MSDRAGSFHRTPHGSLAQEAAKLLDLAQQWLGERSDGVLDEPRVDATSATTEGVPPYCRTCPICRMRRLVAEVNPEAFAHLAEAAASMSAAMKAMGTDDMGTDDTAADHQRRPAP